MRFKVNKKSLTSGSLLGSVKQDGTPDIGLVVNIPSRRRASQSTGVLSGESLTSGYSSGSSFCRTGHRASSACGPLKSDGTPDMRYSANKSANSSPMSSGSSGYSSSLFSTGHRASSACGPLKSDGTPDMRYAANKSAYNSPSSYGSYSRSSSSSSFGCGPLKRDGTPDMRYAANRRK